MKRVSILMVLAIMMFSGCAIFKPYENLSPLDKGRVSVETLSAWYESTHKAIEEKYVTGDAETKALLNRDVIPAMNKLRPLIIKHDKLILLWSETNTKPQDLTSLVSEIEKLILGVITALK
jgi:hypothetical protein